MPLSPPTATTPGPTGPWPWVTRWSEPHGAARHPPDHPTPHPHRVSRRTWRPDRRCRTASEGLRMVYLVLVLLFPVGAGAFLLAMERIEAVLLPAREGGSAQVTVAVPGLDRPGAAVAVPVVDHDRAEHGVLERPARRTHRDPEQPDREQHAQRGPCDGPSPAQVRALAGQHADAQQAGAVCAAGGRPC